MGRINLNITPHATRQMWEHIKTKTVLLIVKLENKGENSVCAVMDGAKVTKLRVRIPTAKLMNWGNRGFSLEPRQKKGKLPLAVLKGKKPGTFNARAKNLGAV